MTGSRQVERVQLSTFRRCIRSVCGYTRCTSSIRTASCTCLQLPGWLDKRRIACQCRLRADPLGRFSFPTVEFGYICWLGYIAPGSGLRVMTANRRYIGRRSLTCCMGGYRGGPYAACCARETLAVLVLRLTSTPTALATVPGVVDKCQTGRRASAHRQTPYRAGPGNPPYPPHHVGPAREIASHAYES
jgi:hypothetical protein